MTDCIGRARNDVTRVAKFSEDGTQRYLLSRRWRPGPRQVCFIMANPSVADTTKDDPTIRRCVGFARGWGYDALLVVNLNTQIATNPKDVQWGTVIDPMALALVRRANRSAETMVAAWGTTVPFDLASKWSYSLRREFPLHVLRLTKYGIPCHPLYLPADLKPVPWPLDNDGS